MPATKRPFSDMTILKSVFYPVVPSSTPCNALLRDYDNTRALLPQQHQDNAKQELGGDLVFVSAKAISALCVC